MIHCPSCGQLVPPESCVDTMMLKLIQHCQREQIPIHQPGFWISERSAAKLVGLAEATLKNRRYQGRSVAQFRQLNLRVQYSLKSIAEFLAHAESSE